MAKTTPRKIPQIQAIAKTSEPLALGVKLLRLRAKNTHQVISSLRDGLGVDSLEHLAQALDMPEHQIAELLEIPARTLSRRKQQGRLSSDESERVYRFSRIVESANQTLGDQDLARQWLTTPKKALGNAVPLEYADTSIGAEEVLDLLGRIQHGVFA